MDLRKYSTDEPTHHRSKKIKTIDEDAIETLIGQSPDIPQDIIEEILVRLPLKSLSKFKCVAKSWLSSILSPKFIKTHLRYSSTSANYRLLLGISYDRDPLQDDVKYGSVSSPICDLFTDDTVVDNADCPNMQTEYQFKVTSSSSNGLLCVSVYRKYRLKHSFIWNPCSRMSKKLPPMASLQSDWNSNSTYGIGYDELKDDYKIVGIFHCSHSDGVYRPEVEIYILKNDSWKWIEGFEGAFYSLSSDVIYAKGKFHFIACFRADGLSRDAGKLVSLDLEDEVYETIEQPEFRQAKYDRNLTVISIGVLRGCISTLYSYALDYVDLWVMKEYGIKESWTKLVTIPYVSGPNSSEDLFPYRMCTLWNGKYVLGRLHQLVVYDPEDNSFVYPLRQRVGNLHLISSMGMYAESLAPLPS